MKRKTRSSGCNYAHVTDAPMKMGSGMLRHRSAIATAGDTP